jgi:hypothetical protein
LTITNVIVRGTSLTAADAAALRNNENSVVNINGTSYVLAPNESNVAIENNGTCEINLSKPVEGADARVQGNIKQNGDKLTLTSIKLVGELLYTGGTVNKNTDVVVSAPGYCWNAAGVFGKHEEETNGHNCGNCNAELSKHTYVNGYCRCGDEEDNTKYVAKIDKTAKFTTLQAAFEAVEPGQTVTLLKEVVSDAWTIEKDNVTIDLGGYRIYFRGNGDAALTITGNNVMIKNGTLCTTGVVGFKTLVDNNGTLLTITNVIVRGTSLTGANAVTLRNNKDCVVSINGTSYVLAPSESNVAIENNGTCNIDLSKPVPGADARIQGTIKTIKGGLNKEETSKHIGVTEEIVAE